MSGELSPFGQLRLAIRAPRAKTRTRCLLMSIDADLLTMLLSAPDTSPYSIIKHTTAAASPWVASVSRPFAQRNWCQLPDFFTQLCLADIFVPLHTTISSHRTHGTSLAWWLSLLVVESVWNPKHPSIQIVAGIGWESLERFSSTLLFLMIKCKSFRNACYQLMISSTVRVVT